MRFEARRRGAEEIDSEDADQWFDGVSETGLYRDDVVRNGDEKEDAGHEPCGRDAAMEG